MQFPGALSSLAEQAILTARNDQSIVSSAKDGEVSHVAKVVLHLPDALVNLWKPHLSSGILTVQGLFCHKTPKAEHISAFTNKTEKPEFGDLLLITNLQTGATNDRRAMLLQAKMGNQNGSPGDFDLDSGGDAVQRAMYAHWPTVGLTGLGKLPLPTFNLAPNQPGSCMASRYACIDPSPSIGRSGWWIEDAQPKQVSPYSGSFQASIPLSLSLIQMLSGGVGASLNSEPEWRKAVAHLLDVASLRDAASKNPPDVLAASGVSKMPHTAKVTNFIANERGFSYSGLYEDDFSRLFHLGMSSRFPSDIYDLIFHNLFDEYFQHHGPRVQIEVEEDDPGFGVLFVSVINPEWRDEPL